MSTSLVRFGPFEFDPTCLELRRRGVPVRIQGQPLQVLALLVSRPGALVTRDALRLALWPDGTFVDFEHGLNAAMRRLRRALGDAAATPRFIQTLARRGYRFAASIEREARPQSSDMPLSPKSIAVLPFDNATGDRDSDYLVEGVTERLINELGLLLGLQVIARSAAYRHGRGSDPCEAGRKLGVAAVIVGVVRQWAGTTLSMHAELVDVATGFQLWGGSYERSPEDVGGLEQDLAADLRVALQLRASASEPRPTRKPVTTNAAAHREYLKGRYFLNRMDETAIRRAIHHFDNAVAADPAYSIAHCGLAECYSLFAFLGLEAPRVVLPRAQAAACIALELDHELAEAHASLASISKVYEWDWRQAEAGYRRALALNPNYSTAHRWYAAHLAAIGRRDEAFAAMQKASDLDPVSPIIVTELAWHSYMAREFDAARRHARHALDLQPGFPPALFTLGLACEQLGAFDEALESFQGALLPVPNPAVVASQAHLLAAMGRRKEARQAAAWMDERSRERYVPSYWFAVMAAAFDTRESGLTSLERAVDEHDVWLVWLGTEPRLDPLRHEDRFQRVLNRIGLEHSAAGSDDAKRSLVDFDPNLLPV